MSMSLRKQSTTGSVQRKWQMLALIILAFLTVVVITYVMLYTVGHINLLHLMSADGATPDILNWHP